MKTTTKIFLLLLMVCGLSTTMQAKKIQKPQVYVFGFSASFQDSVIYFTEIQEVKGAWMDNKTQFLLGRQHYSRQLKDYLANEKKQSNRVCLVMFAEKKEKAEKEWMKLRKKYTANDGKNYEVRLLNASDFKFEVVDMSDEGE